MIHHNNLAPEKKADGVEAFETPSDLQVYIYIYIYVYVPRDNGFISKKSVSKLFSVYKKIKEAR